MHPEQAKEWQMAEPVTLEIFTDYV